MTELTPEERARFLAHLHDIVEHSVACADKIEAEGREGMENVERKYRRLAACALQLALSDWFDPYEDESMRAIVTPIDSRERPAPSHHGGNDGQARP